MNESRRAEAIASHSNCSTDTNWQTYRAFERELELPVPIQTAPDFIPEILRDAGGTALFFGAYPDAGDFVFKSGKDATRGLARSLADEYGADVYTSCTLVLTEAY